MKRKAAIFRGISAVMAVLMTLSISAANLTFKYDAIINKALGIATTATSGGSSQNIYWPNSYGYDDTALVEVNRDAAAANVTIQEEGTVLLKNENGALPLAKGSRMTIFGAASVNSSIFNTMTASYMSYTTLLDAMEAEFGADNLNETLCTEVYAVPEGPGGPGPMMGGSGISTVTESAIGDVTAKESTWQSDYNDAAIVVLARSGSEGNDVCQYASDDTYEDGSPRRMLDLSSNEQDLVEYLAAQKEQGVFDKIIVIVASEYPMELGFLNTYGIDAAILTGTCGTFGCTAIAEVLSGAVNPSGRLVDTYAANSLSAPATVYASLEGTQKWSNYEELNEANPLVNTGDGANIDYYNIYAEGIYVGYKYYETRYEDVVMNQGGAASAVGSSAGTAWSYADEMVYPFGYGLSYTTFEETLDAVEYDADSDSYNISVTVTNTGGTAGKDVVEVYSQTPYGDYERTNLVEKAAVNLAGYGKTALLAPGESQELTINVQRYFLASYDTYGAGTYILSAGEYYFAIGDDAHDALNNILAAKGYTTADKMTADGDMAKTYTWTQESLDAETYRTSVYTGMEITNQFDDADLRYYGYDFTYLTRSDWADTYPVEAVQLSANDSIISTISNYDYVTPADAPAVSDFTQEADNGLQLIDMLDVPFDDDESWDKFLDQMSVKELANLMTDNISVQAVPDLGIVGSTRVDDDTNPGGQFRWVSHPTSARTWNDEMFTLRGYYEGLICALNNGDEIWYGASNLHRTPFGGRTNQYFSEDAILSYWGGYYEAQACQSVGVLCGVKHFTTNDQETYRTGLSTFLTEQPMREIYLRAFEGSFQGGALSTMCALNRIGTRLAKNHYALLTTVLRGEWGFQGHVTSDGYVDLGYFNNTLEELVAGMDYGCIDTSGYNASQVIKAINDDGDGYILQAIRLAAKRNLYTMLHTTRINGLGEGSSLITIVPAWEKALIAANIITAIGFVGFAVLSAVTGRKGKRTAVSVEEGQR